MNIAPILGVVFTTPPNGAQDPNSLQDTLLPILAIVGPGAIVLAIMVYVTLRKHRPY